MTHINWKTIDIVSKHKGKCHYELQRSLLLVDILKNIFEFSIINENVTVCKISNNKGNISSKKTSIDTVIYFIQITLANEVKELLKLHKIDKNGLLRSSIYTEKDINEITYWSEMSRIYFFSIKAIQKTIDNIRIIYNIDNQEDTDEEIHSEEMADEQIHSEEIHSEEIADNSIQQEIANDSSQKSFQDVKLKNEGCCKITPFKSIMYGRGHVRYFEDNKYYHGIGFDDHPYKTNPKHDKCLYHYYNTDIILNEHILWETEDVTHYCTNCCVDWELSADKKYFNVYKCNGHSIK